ncbi:pyridoxal-phosphate dependent enzyme [Corynebacterium poyangense]|uniref:Pyridoxal-phosphate dependent enzyme n=2 Tax=Corynebacterium poyangense TaxID=2684405 RepID=A0A7H0SS29_9CORY|nr:pyridoxal-phosphate dependent enzyme [Corynebacterium poyangense]QNQ91354.1 pyridoxal-phosphate dependent enzyme [Corynebacterium poyangense]
MADLAENISATIGHTPLVKLQRIPLAHGVSLYAKLEYFNPGGSAKDRTAAALIKNAQENGILHPGTPIVESSSGNLGIALAREALLGGWEFHCVVDDRINTTTLKYLSALGAHIHQVATQPDPEFDRLAARRAKVAELLAAIPGAVTMDQYGNQAAFEAHASGTMSEILSSLGTTPDALYVAISTTGTLGGCRRRLEQAQAKTKVVAVDAEGSVLYGGCRGQRHLPGFGAGVTPELSRFVTPDTLQRIPDIYSVAGARFLARKEGIVVGASAGAVTAAILEDRSHFQEQEQVVAIFHDGGTPYMDTIFDDAWVEHHLGASVEDLEKLMEKWEH